MYEFVGLRAEDKRAKQARMVAQKVAEINLDDVELQDADLLVHDHVHGEDSVFVIKKTLQWKLEQYILVWMSLGL